MDTSLPAQQGAQPLALPGSDLFETVRRKLIDDLGPALMGGALSFR
ncbi:hypothetical protein [Streptomyces sp. NPDC012888]